MITYSDLFLALPILIIGGGILAGLIIEMFFPKQKALLAWFTMFVFLCAAYYSLLSWYPSKIIFNGMYAAGGIYHLFHFIFNFSAAVIVLFSMEYLKKLSVEFGEFYILLLSAVLGMMLISSAKNLVMVFIGLEQMSICFYVLAGFRRKDAKSNESALKYFLLGAFATGFLVYGMALMYGAAGSFDYSIFAGAKPEVMKNPIFLIGSVLFIIGFTFKIAAVPFHMWVPDVYQGAPTNVTAFMSTAGKAAAFSAILFFLSIKGMYSAEQFIFIKKFMAPFLAVISTISMLYGAIVAISQNDVKRMLAYSSIAHAGYMLIGIASFSPEGFQGVVFYLMVYTLMNVGIFGIITILESKEGKFLEFKDYAGLNSRSPVLAGLLALFLFALAGLPPFAGFLAKYFVFIGALNSGMTWLAIMGVISSVISVYFYLRLIVIMYFQKAESDEKIPVSQFAFVGVVLVFILFITISIFPGKLESLISGSMH